MRLASDLRPQRFLNPGQAFVEAQIAKQVVPVTESIALQVTAVAPVLSAADTITDGASGTILSSE